MQQRAIASDKGAGARSPSSKRKGMVFSPMAAADRAAVRKEMESRLWADFAKQYPATAPLFTAINNARG